MTILVQVRNIKCRCKCEEILCFALRVVVVCFGVFLVETRIELRDYNKACSAK